jgi:hypothetical protein
MTVPNTGYRKELNRGSKKCAQARRFHAPVSKLKARQRIVELMKKLMTALLALCTLAGCSHHYHPLEAGKTARLVSEVINDAPRCGTYKKRLASAAMDDDAIDAIYHEATKDQCINKDI